jgi:hypothetical protein
MKNHSSSRAGKGKTAYRTPHSFIADRPEFLKNKNSQSYPSNAFKGGMQGKNSQSRRAIPRSK